MKTKKGYILLEALLALVVLTMVFFSIIPTFGILLKRQSRSRYEARASLLLQEAIESTYNIFISDWNAPYFSSGDYHPSVASNGKWKLSLGKEENLQTLFTRSIQIKYACRNSSGDIVDTCSGANVDTSTRIVTAQVSWQEDQNQKEINTRLLLINNE